METPGKGKGQGGKGLDKEHEISRINPDTGQLETQTITQRDWRDGGKQLRAEGWTRPEGVDEDEGEEEEDEGEDEPEV